MRKGPKYRNKQRDLGLLLHMPNNNV